MSDCARFLLVFQRVEALHHRIEGWIRPCAGRHHGEAQRSRSHPQQIFLLHESPHCSAPRILRVTGSPRSEQANGSPLLRLIQRPAYTNLTGMGLRSLMHQKALSVTLLRHLARRRTDRLGMRLLVVEDNEELAQLLAKGLESAGFGADLVTTAAQARKVLTTTRY